MSELVVHVTSPHGYTLTGDSRGIIVDSRLRGQVWTWAWDNQIEIEYHGTLAGRDLWYVKNDQHRTAFALRWM